MGGVWPERLEVAGLGSLWDGRVQVGPPVGGQGDLLRGTKFARS